MSSGLYRLNRTPRVPIMPRKQRYHYDFPRPAVTVDVIILTIVEEDLRVLLIRRKRPPYAGRWAIPGGFVEMGETLEEAARRELREETGVRDVYLEQLYTFGDPHRDPRGRVITVAYFVLLNAESLSVRAADDAAGVGWFSVYHLPRLAFDHDRIVDYALKRLRAKLEWTTVGFHLLPKKFTLPELQRIHEVILDEKLDTRNFRKGMLSRGLLEELNETRRDGPHRPARLYRFVRKKED
jgi:8-oxo-dGTP diphosphatase